MSDNFFVSLGAGENQTPLIIEAQKMGMRVIGVDINPQAKGLAHCEIRIQESIYNYRRILRKLRQFVIDEKIIGIACAGFGKGIFSAAWIADKLKLTSPSLQALQILSDKYSLRVFLAEKKITNPFFRQPKFLSLYRRYKKIEIEELGYPLILKPVNGAGKKNIFEAKNFSELKPKLYKSFLKTLNKIPQEMILEEKIEGDEITVSGLIEKGKYHLVLISDKITSRQAPFIELEHHFPSRYQDYAKEITALHQEITQLLALDATSLVSEWKIHDNNFYLIEMAAQIPGEFFARFLIPQAVKYNFYKQLVCLACAKKIETRKGFSRKKIQISYQPTKLNNLQWEKFTQASRFSLILNEAAPLKLEEVDTNAKRFGVAAFIK